MFHSVNRKLLNNSYTLCSNVEKLISNRSFSSIAFIENRTFLPTSSQNKPGRYEQTKNYSTNKSETKKNYKLVDLVTNPAPESPKPPKPFDYVTNSELTFYDPPYLARDPPFPIYGALNINIKGYDFTVLDHFFLFVQKLCTGLKIDIVEAYPMPARSINIKTYQAFSSNIDRQYDLKMFHRVVRIKELKSTMAPILFEAVQLNLPEGVKLSIAPPTPDEDEFRYVPDTDMQNLKKELEELSKNPKQQEILEAQAAAAAAKAPTPAAKAPATPPAKPAAPKK